MNLGLATLAALFCWVGFAQAADETQTVRVSITKADCSRLVAHTPRDDVTYKPGEGLHGKKVAPADLPGSGAGAIPNLVPNVLEIPLNVKPMSGLAYATRGVGDSTMSLGTIKYDMGRNSFTFNDKPLGNQDQQELAEACRRQGIR